MEKKMEQLTITEALSEVNLIKKKIIAKQDKIKQNLIRYDHLPDPFKNDGGIEQVIISESQGIMDLSRRLEKIRAGISKANLGNAIKIGNEAKTIHDWLIWKREIASGQISFLGHCNSAVRTHLDQSGKQPQVYKDPEGQTHLVKTTPNINYPEWLKYQAELTETLEKLDGQLSLKNATIAIEF
jgi:hypothetical protein